MYSPLRDSALGQKQAVAGVIVNRTQKEIPSAETLAQVEVRAIAAVVEAAKDSLLHNIY